MFGWLGNSVARQLLELGHPKNTDVTSFSLVERS